MLQIEGFQKICNTQNCPSNFLFVWLMTQYLIFTSYLVNCQWGGWSQYSTCSKSCGGGTQAKSRSKTVEEKYGGKCSNSYNKTRACNTQNCPGNFLFQKFLSYSYANLCPNSNFDFAKPFATIFVKKVDEIKIWHSEYITKGFLPLWYVKSCM